MDLKKPVVLLTNSYSPKVLEFVQSRLPEGLEFRSLEKAERTELIQRAKEADYFLASGRLKIDREVIDAAPKLRMVQRTGVGLDSIDVKYLGVKGIPLQVNHGVNARAVAEHTVMLMLSTLRNTAVIDSQLRSGIWLKNDNGIQNSTLSGKTIGLIGLGNIGLEVVQLLKGFNVEILYTKRTRLDAYTEQKLGVNHVELKTLLSKADIVSLHCALTTETRGMINANLIKSMKPRAIIVNTGRGALIDEKALIEALQSGLLGGAGLDVFENEPISHNSALFSLDRTVCSPHIAGLTKETFGEMIDKAFLAIQRHNLSRNQSL
jgi:phosphoglycerate dehydrogenase-like enzyme